MGYSYGDKATSATGIWLWLQGVSNQKRKDYQGLNYLPKQLDINQKDKWYKDLLHSFCTKVLEMQISRKDLNKKFRLVYKLECLVQDNFHKFTKFVKDNYEPN